MSDIKVNQSPDYEQDPSYYNLDEEVLNDLHEALLKYESEEKEKKE
jgi:hypothetical protein